MLRVHASVVQLRFPTWAARWYCTRYLLPKHLAAAAWAPHSAKLSAKSLID